MFNKAIQLLVILLAALPTFCQSTVDIKIQLLTNDAIGDVNLNKEPFFEWVKVLNEEILKATEKIEGNKDLILVFTLHQDKDVDISIGSRPALTAVSIEALKNNLLSLKAPRTKITDYSFLFLAKINDGANEDLKFIPEVLFPYEKEILAFNKLTLLEKKTSLQNWSTNELIPLLGAIESKVDPKFEGVLNFGKMISEKSFLNQPINDFTGKNSDYWRATMEMEVGNLMIPFSKVCMLISNGEFDQAERLLFIVDYFSNEGTLPYHLGVELNAKLSSMKTELEKEINEGIKLHDKGMFNEAVALYENLLKSFPKSAWLNYELYYSRSAIEPEDKRIDMWYEVKPNVYACDPMYPLDINARNGIESYLLFSRNEIGTLFQSKKTAKKDFVRYADIAFDLGNYEFAAQLYWIILGTMNKGDYEDRDLIAHYLYCLDKLGDKELIKNFKDDYKKQFAKIEKERKKLIEKSDYYKMMK